MIGKHNCLFVCLFVHFFNGSNEEDVITDLKDIYDVGTFVQITELHEVGDKMRMIIQGHRRFVAHSLS